MNATATPRSQAESTERPAIHTSATTPPTTHNATTQPPATTNTTVQTTVTADTKTTTQRPNDSPAPTTNAQSRSLSQQSNGPTRTQRIGAALRRMLTIQIKKPEAPFIIRWNLVCLLVALYNVFVVSFRASFRVADAWVYFLAPDIIADVVYLADIVVRFHTMIEVRGIPVAEKPRIARLYLRSWFAVDALALLPLEWIAIWLPMGAEAVAWLRINKMLKFARLNHYFDIWEARSRYSPAVFRIIKSTILTLLVTHAMACVYILVIHIEGDAVSQPFLDVNSDILTRSLASQYLRCVFWSFATLSGVENTYPVSDLETWTCIMVSIAGIALYVMIIGSVGSVLTQLGSSDALFEQKMDAVNAFMAYRRLPAPLQDRIRNYYSYLWRSRRGTSEDDILADIPASLKLDIALSLNQELIERVPLFHNIDPEFINAVVLKLKPRVSLPNAYIIKHNEVAKEMFFLSRGEAHVLGGPDGNTVIHTFRDGAFFGEIGIFYDIRRTASVRAADYCDLFVLTKLDFEQIARDFPEQSGLIYRAAEERYAAQVALQQQQQNQQE